MARTWSQWTVSGNLNPRCRVGGTPKHMTERPSQLVLGLCQVLSLVGTGEAILGPLSVSAE